MEHLSGMVACLRLLIVVWSYYYNREGYIGSSRTYVYETKGEWNVYSWS